MGRFVRSARGEKSRLLGLPIQTTVPLSEHDDNVEDELVELEVRPLSTGDVTDNT